MKKNFLMVSALALSACGNCTDSHRDQWDLNEHENQGERTTDVGVDTSSDVVVDADSYDASVEDSGSSDPICITRGQMRDAIYACYDTAGFICRKDERFENEWGQLLAGQKINECSLLGCAVEPVDDAITVFVQERWDYSISKYEYTAVLERLFGLNCEQDLVDKYGVKYSVTPEWAFDSVLWAIDNGYLSVEDALSDDACFSINMLETFEEKCTEDLANIVDE